MRESIEEVLKAYFVFYLLFFVSLCVSLWLKIKIFEFFY